MQSLAPRQSTGETRAFQDIIPHLVHHKIDILAYAILDRTGLETMFPHRDVALCLDFGLTSLHEEGHAFGISRIWSDSFEIRGHFPGAPKLPGHWSFEKMCLTSALIKACIPPEKRLGRSYLPILSAIYEARFLQPIVPGNTLVMRSEYLKDHIEGKDWRKPAFHIDAYVGGTLCAKATIGATLLPCRR